MIRSSWWSIIIVLSAIAVALAIVADAGTPVRPLLVFWFLLVCPGMAFVRLLRIEERLIELVLAIALSVTLDTIVAEIMALNKIWSFRGGLFVLICLSLLGAALQMMQALNQLPSSTRQGASKP
jgi:hypothetical protein